MLVLGRLLLGAAFIFAGLRNIQNATFLTQLIAARGVPQARLALSAGIVLQIIAGALVIAGVWTAIACAVLLLFLVVATPMFHNFWDHRGPERASRINGFVGNVALGGGFLTLIAQSV
ncbi:DoxX family protein [Mesorhizobium calcicola]|uniref:DoxX family protein n=1 Tax=Mesorhizobium calcicola TaxID=1300310 RepID=A0ABW4WQ01_9HYPH